MSENVEKSLVNILSLKDELKSWEKTFADANGGRKPSRSDIKADPSIAAKYKLYESHRRQVRLQKPVETQCFTPRKSRSTDKSHMTPQRRSTPSRQSSQLFHNPTNDLENTKGVDGEANDGTTPSKNAPFTALGPTPQKDGRVMGIFDHLSSTTPRMETRPALGDRSPNVAQTPSRSAATTTLVPTSVSPQKLTRTPQSSGKRFLLDSFVTPSKRQCLDEGTPSSVRHMRTPAFLRRCSEMCEPVAEDDARVARPFHRKPFGRSLSSMIRDMRQQQEDKLEEDLQVLREMEEGGKQPPQRSVVKVLDSQFEEDEDAMAALEESERQELAATDTQPTKAWKKKGQKRQTRRVIMRPVRSQAQEENPLHPTIGKEASKTVGSGDEAVGSDEDDPVSDYEDRKSHEKDQTKCKASAAPAQKREQKKGAKKINPNAASHANFRSLKIKNKNSKAKGRGRFSRGR